MGAELKMPWDQELQHDSISVLKTSDYTESISEQLGETTGTRTSEKYGMGKPYRIKIMGDIKSDSNK